MTLRRLATLLSGDRCTKKRTLFGDGSAVLSVFTCLMVTSVIFRCSIASLTSSAVYSELMPFSTKTLFLFSFGVYVKTLSALVSNVVLTLLYSSRLPVYMT